MGPRERNNSGTFVETVSLEDVLGVFNAVRGPVITSSDVADQLDCTTEAARQKLQRLYDRGEVNKRKTGRVVVWWHTDGTPPTPSKRTTADTEQDLDAVNPIDAALKGWSYGHALDAKEANQIIARRSLAWLATVPTEPVKQSNGPVDELARVNPEGQKADCLWRTLIRGEAWQYAKEQGYVEEPKGRQYEWVGPAVEWDGEIDDPIDLNDVQTDGGVYDPTEEFDQ